MSDTPPRVLFVDDEPNLRLTIPLILESQGFEVVAAPDVASAVKLITEQTFDVLLSDLNMQDLSDGFTVVSTMRKLQPKCRTLILTGYPDIDGALDQLRGQVDGYILKPTRPDALAQRLRDQLAEPHAALSNVHHSFAELIRQNKEGLLERWEQSIARDPVLQTMGVPREQLRDGLPDLVDEVVIALESGRSPAQSIDQVRSLALAAARRHGAERQKQGYTLDQLFKEIRLLQCGLFDLAQENLLDLDISSIIPDLTLATDTIEILVGTSIQTFVDAERGEPQSVES